MGQNKQYDPQVYKRLELVRKQFQNSVAEQKKQESAERKQRLISYFAQNKARLTRIIVYAILAILVLAVIGVMVAGAVAAR